MKLIFYPGQFGCMAPKRCGESSRSSGGGGEGSGRGARGAIVVKENPLWRGERLDPQAASLVETHLPSKTAAPPPPPQGWNTIIIAGFPAHRLRILYIASLKKVKEEVNSLGNTSLFSSLEQVEVCECVIEHSVCVRRAWTVAHTHTGWRNSQEKSDRSPPPAEEA